MRQVLEALEERLAQDVVPAIGGEYFDRKILKDGLDAIA